MQAPQRAVATRSVGGMGQRDAGTGGLPRKGRKMCDRAERCLKRRDAGQIAARHAGKNRMLDMRGQKDHFASL